jgi:hypothetical protein
MAKEDGLLDLSFDLRKAQKAIRLRQENKNWLPVPNKHLLTANILFFSFENILPFLQ